MPNTNFQTIHQMGQAINEVVRQATGRDAVQNIDMDHVTVAQNHYYDEVTVSGAVVSSIDRVGGSPLEECVVQIEPVQGGSGDPSPSNVRPITGWTGAKITCTGKNLANFVQNKGINAAGVVTEHVGRLATVEPIKIEDGVTYKYLSFYTGSLEPLAIIAVWKGDSLIRRTANIRPGNTLNTSGGDRFYVCDYTGDSNLESILPMVVKSTDIVDVYEPFGIVYSIPFPAEAGTVYGGTLDVTTGLLTVDRGVAVFDGDEDWQAASSPQAQYLPIGTAFSNINRQAYEKVICSHVKMRSTIISSELLIGEACYNSTLTNWLVNMGFTSVAELKSYLATSPMTVTYPLFTPSTYQLTPTEIRTLLGQNNIWADTGNIEVKFILLKEV